MYIFGDSEAVTEMSIIICICYTHWVHIPVSDCSEGAIEDNGA